MAKKRKQKKSAVTPGKAVLIAVLGVVMVAVWGNAFLGGEKRVASRSKRPRSARTQRAAPQADAAAVSVAPAVEWPTISVQDAVRNDPFGKPEWAVVAKPRVENPSVAAGPIDPSGASRDELEAAGASMILISGDTRIARIGEQDVRVGDRVGAFVVVDITAEGVVLDAPGAKKN